MSIHPKLVRLRSDARRLLALVGFLSVACGGRSRNEQTERNRHPNEIRHTLVRPRVSLAGGAPAFAGETLGVATLAHFGEESAPDVVVAIERDSEFELVELGFGYYPALAASSDTFHVVWVEDATTPTEGVLKLGRVAVDGTVRGVIDVMSPITEPNGCDIAADGELAAVVCTNVAAVCDAEGCRTLALPECTPAGQPRVVWDGIGFALARTCWALETGADLELRVSRFSRSAEWILPESLLLGWPTDDPLMQATPALAVHVGRTYLAAFDTLAELNDSLRMFPEPAYLRRLRPFEPNSNHYELVAFDDRVVLADVGCIVSLESSNGDGVLRLFDASLSSLGAPSVVVDDCKFVRLATSPSGRTVLVRPAPNSVLVEDVDLGDGQRVSPRLVASPAGEPYVQTVTCDSDECAMAIREPGVESAPFFDDRIVRVVAGGSELAERDITSRCTDSTCRMLFTPSGDTVVYEGTSTLRWLDAAEREAWTRQLPTQVADVTVDNPERPWASGYDNERAWHWRLGPNGPDEASMDGPLANEARLRGSTFACDDGVYVLMFEGERLEIFPLEANGLGTSRGVLPSRSWVACAGGQFAAFMQSPGEPGLARLLADGTVLADVSLEAPIVYWGASGDSIVLLLRPDDGTDTWFPSSRPIVVELTPDGGMRTRVLELPEPGWFGNMNSFSPFQGAVTLVPRTVHLLWKSESALMLSSFPTTD